jgi:hypothetical protein
MSNLDGMGNDALKVYKEKFEEIEGEINALRDSFNESKLDEPKMIARLHQF